MEITPRQVSKDILDLLLGRLKTALFDVSEKQGVTPIQFSALYCLYRCGEIPMGRIADLLHCDPSNVTGLVDRLVSHDMLTRQECPTDRRAKTLRLTLKGEQLIDAAYKELPAKFGLDKLSPSELQTLHHLLIKLSD